MTESTDFPVVANSWSVAHALFGMMADVQQIELLRAMGQALDQAERMESIRQREDRVRQVKDLHTLTHVFWKGLKVETRNAHFLIGRRIDTILAGIKECKDAGAARMAPANWDNPFACPVCGADAYDRCANGHGGWRGDTFYPHLRGAPLSPEWAAGHPANVK